MRSLKSTKWGNKLYIIDKSYEARLHGKDSIDSIKYFPEWYCHTMRWSCTMCSPNLVDSAAYAESSRVWRDVVCSVRTEIDVLNW